MRLTEQAGRGIELTPAAAILVAHTEALLARLPRPSPTWPPSATRSPGGSPSAFPSAAARIVATAQAALANSAPHVQLDLAEMEPDESLPALLRGHNRRRRRAQYDLLPRPLDPLFEQRERPGPRSARRPGQLPAGRADGPG